MSLVLGAFSPASEETAIFYILAVACFLLGAFGGAASRKFPGLIGLGLAFFVFPAMWQTVDVAFE